MEEKKIGSNQLIMHIIVLMLLITSILGGVYMIIDKKVSTIVKNEILSIEYNKAGGKANFDFMAKSTADQLTKFREQYGDSGIPNQPTANNNQARNNDKVVAGSTTISLDKVKQVTENTYILGNPDAKISFVEYSDLECPFCKKLHEAGTIDQILENYKDEVNFIFKHFPLDFHPQAEMEAQAVECVGELAGTDKYYSFVNEVFKNSKANGRSYTIDSISDLAGTMGVDIDKVKQCISSNKYKEKVNLQMSEGQSFGVTGTPGNVLINKETGEYKLLPGAYPFANFKTIIDGFLNK